MDSHLAALLRAKRHENTARKSDELDAWVMQALQDVQNDAPRSSIVWREDRAYIGLNTSEV